MKMKLFGYKFNLEVAIICIVLGIFIGVTTICGCSCAKEAFVSPSRPAMLNNTSMSDGVPGQNTGDESWRQPQTNNSEMQMNTNKATSLSFFDKNNFKPECCSYSSYSGTGGCVCINSEQSTFLKNRGGNCSGKDCSF